MSIWGILGWGHLAAGGIVACWVAYKLRGEDFSEVQEGMMKDPQIRPFSGLVKSKTVILLLTVLIGYVGLACLGVVYARDKKDP